MDNPVFLFDCSEVVLRGLKGTEMLLAPILGIEPERIHEQFHIDAINRFFLGNISEDEYWNAVVDEHGWDIDISSLKKAVRKNFAEIAGTRDIILDLRSQGHRIGLLSNHAKEWVEECERRFRHHGLFDVAVYSCDIGIQKPDEGAYRFALDRLSVNPNLVCFVDDSQPNLDAAQSLGMRTIRYRSGKQLSADLMASNSIGH